MNFFKQISKRSISLIILFILSLGTIFASLFLTKPQHITQNAQSTNNTVTIDLTSPLTTSQFYTGATYTENDTIMNTNTAAQQLMKNALSYQNIFIMGWGAGNPEPSPGQYDWGDIDQRVQLARTTGSKIIISLCCAPDWMKGGTAGQTDWSKLETAPLSTHYADFAELAKQVALRYKDVQYFQVWNELKGFWSDSLNRWNYEGYTQMYNLVYDAIKSVRTDAKVGGPYPSVGSTATYSTATPDLNSIDSRIKDVTTYWLANKHGADFMIFDGGPGPLDNVLSSGVSNEFFAGQFYNDVAAWARQQPGGATLPISWAEWYPGSQQDWKDLNHFNAVMANDLIYTIKSGATFALPWGISGDAQGFALPEGIMTNTGQPTPFYNTYVAIKNNFQAGTQLFKDTSPDTVTVLASKTKTLLVNHVNQPQTLSVNGTTVNLTPYQVVVINTPNTSTNPTNVPTQTNVTPTTVVPTYVCGGSQNSICPTTTPKISSNPGIPSNAISPSSVIIPSTVSIIPSQPCTNTQAITAQQQVAHKKHQKKSDHNNLGLLTQLLGLILQLLNLIQKLFGGSPVNLPSPNPSIPC